MDEATDAGGLSLEGQRAVNEYEATLIDDRLDMPGDPQFDRAGQASAKPITSETTDSSLENDSQELVAGTEVSVRTPERMQILTWC